MHSFLKHGAQAWCPSRHRDGATHTFCLSKRQTQCLPAGAGSSYQKIGAQPVARAFQHRLGCFQETRRNWTVGMGFKLWEPVILFEIIWPRQKYFLKTSHSGLWLQKAFGLLVSFVVVRVRRWIYASRRSEEGGNPLASGCPDFTSKKSLGWGLVPWCVLGGGWGLCPPSWPSSEGFFPELFWLCNTD
jgi:hypothetical protein